VLAGIVSREAVPLAASASAEASCSTLAGPRAAAHAGEDGKDVRVTIRKIVEDATTLDLDRPFDGLRPFSMGGPAGCRSAAARWALR